MGNRVLVVEDEIDLIQVVKYQLEKEGFEVIAATNGQDGLKKLQEEPLPHVILLDLMLPDMSGKEICRIVKGDNRLSHIPIIMVTARGEEIDRIVGFELGADDYVVKPFSIREFGLRIRAVLRNKPTQRTQAATKPQTGMFRMDVELHQAWLGDQLLDLTVLEFELLSTLMNQPGRVFTRNDLLEKVWRNPLTVTERTVIH